MKRITLFLFAVLISLSLCACSANDTSTSSIDSLPQAPAAEVAATPPDSADSFTNARGDYSYTTDGDVYNAADEAYNAADSGSYKYAEDEPATPLPLLTPNNSMEAKLAYEVDIRLQTTGFMAGSRMLLTTVAEIGGYSLSTYIEGRDMFDESGLRYARYDLRVPSSKLSDFLVKMEDNYNLLRLEQNSQDITAHYGEADTRLEDLREQEARLLETLETETDTDNILEIEYELSMIQRQIATLEASLSSMDKAIIYSTVSVHLYEAREPEVIEPEPEPTWGDRLSETTQDSLASFIAFFQGLFLFLIAALPTLVVLAIFVAVAWVVIRILRKKGLIPAKKETTDNPPSSNA